MQVYSLWIKKWILILSDNFSIWCIVFNLNINIQFICKIHFSTTYIMLLNYGPCIIVPSEGPPPLKLKSNRNFVFIKSLENFLLSAFCKYFQCKAMEPCKNWFNLHAVVNMCICIYKNQQINLNVTDALKKSERLEKLLVHCFCVNSSIWHTVVATATHLK